MPERPLTPEEKKLLQQQERVYRMVQKMMLTMYQTALSLPEIKAAFKRASVSENAFSFEQYNSASKAVNKILRTYSGQIDQLVLTGIEEAWKEGDNGLWREISERLAKTEAEQTLFNSIRKEATIAHKGPVAKDFYLKEQGGKTISSRIWKNVEQSKNELEIIIQSGIMEGRSADDLAREAQSYLRHPDKLFRRVRNKATGKLELSKAAQNYHPGTGKYRSSYKNALRLVSNEINRAYREAYWQGLQNNPLVVGYEIQLSNNHTCSDGQGGIIQGWTDMCDELAGRYPKWFKWTGWHVNCRCRMVAILISKEEFSARVKARADDKLDEWEAKNVVTNVPAALNNWLSANKDRIDKAVSMPYWILDNFKGGVVANGFNY
jgi:hypothetical protein